MDGVWLGVPGTELEGVTLGVTDGVVEGVADTVFGSE
jgi:hypothetical protein